MLEQADSELFAARYRKAATLYEAVLKQNPDQADARYGLVRALLKDNRHLEAYAVADEGLQRNPKSAPILAAAGMAALRRGDILKSETHYREAVKIDPNHHGGLRGLASILQALSQGKSAESLLLRAYRNYPRDPALMRAYANTLKGAEHIAALERVLPLLDPQSEEAMELRAHIAGDHATGDRKLRQLLSPYTATKIKLNLIQDGPRRPIGWGVRVRLNDRQSADLLLDTGASGISVSPRIAQKAGLQPVTGAASKTRGVGDEAAPTMYSFGIDSGASTTIVDTEIASTSASVYRDSTLRVSGIQGDVDKPSRTERVVLQFAGFKQENASLVAVSLNNVSDAMGVGLGGVLGMPILEQMTVILDYRASAVRFEYKK